MYYKYFDGVRMRGVKDPEFLERITPTFICLISTAIWHGIRAWSTGTYVKPDHFQSQNESVVSKNPNVLTAMAEALRAFITALKTFRLSILDLRADIETGVETFNRMSNTWKGRSRQNQEATLEVIKDNLREKVCYRWRLQWQSAFPDIEANFDRYERRKASLSRLYRKMDSARTTKR